jgi:hypothetical protein
MEPHDPKTLTRLFLSCVFLAKRPNVRSCNQALKYLCFPYLYSLKEDLSPLYCYYFFTFTQAEKAEKEARDLKGTMRKRMEFLDFD